jgi:hypothetical protein
MGAPLGLAQSSGQSSALIGADDRVQRNACAGAVGRGLSLAPKTERLVRRWRTAGLRRLNPRHGTRSYPDPSAFASRRSSASVVEDGWMGVSPIADTRALGGVRNAGAS